MEIELIKKYFWWIVYILYTHTTCIIWDIGRNAPWKNVEYVFPKLWLNKGVNHTQDFKVLTLTNNEKKTQMLSYFGKNTRHVNDQTLNFLTLTWNLFTLVSGQVDIYHPANLSGIRRDWKFPPNLRKLSVKKFYSHNKFCWDKIYLNGITLITQGILLQICRISSSMKLNWWSTINVHF